MGRVRRIPGGPSVRWRWTSSPARSRGGDVFMGGWGGRNPPILVVSVGGGKTTPTSIFEGNCKSSPALRADLARPAQLPQATAAITCTCVAPGFAVRICPAPDPAAANHRLKLPRCPLTLLRPARRPGLESWPRATATRSTGSVQDLRKHRLGQLPDSCCHVPINLWVRWQQRARVGSDAGLIATKKP